MYTVCRGISFCAQRTGIPRLHRYDVAFPTRIDTSFSAGEWYFSHHPFFSMPFGICCLLPCSFFLLGEELHCLRHQETLAVRAVLRAKRRDVKAPWPPTRGGEGWSGTGIAICNSVKVNIQGRGIESEASRHPQSTLPATDGNWRVPNGQTSFRAIPSSRVYCSSGTHSVSGIHPALHLQPRRWL